MPALKEVQEAPVLTPSSADSARFVSRVFAPSPGLAPPPQKAPSIPLYGVHADSRAAEERHRWRQELIAWIGIAVIGVVSAITVYMLWIKAAPGY